jgi:hypothetical protein
VKLLPLMPGSSLSTGHRILSHGIEYYTFRVSAATAMGIAKGVERTGTWKLQAPSLYLVEPRPSYCELLSFRMKQVSKDEFEINLQLARGHHLLAEFFSRHLGATAKKSGSYILLSCECHKEVKTLEERSLPVKDWLWEDFNETKTIDSPAENGYIG